MIPHRGAQVLTVTVFACIVVLGLYIGFGGASYAPAKVADPCDPRPIEAPEGIEATLQQLALSALDGAACELRITREDLVLSLADPEGRARFLDERQISDETLEAAVRGGLQRAYDDAVRVGEIGGIEAFVLGQAIDRVPIDLLVDIAQSESGQEAAALLEDLAAGQGAQDAIGTLEDLLGG
jgi:hypothetical protein